VDPFGHRLDCLLRIRDTARTFRGRMLSHCRARLVSYGSPRRSVAATCRTFPLISRGPDREGIPGGGRE